MSFIFVIYVFLLFVQQLSFPVYVFLSSIYDYNLGSTLYVSFFLWFEYCAYVDFIVFNSINISSSFPFRVVFQNIHLGMFFRPCCFSLIRELYSFLFILFLAGVLNLVSVLVKGIELVLWALISFYWEREYTSFCPARDQPQCIWATHYTHRQCRRSSNKIVAFSLSSKAYSIWLSEEQ